ncbi:hypothetical protein MWU54_12890 [Marivita sp. S6314]|uniref:hypothetical protein n=1 Tax=Marivita sp. S6314 TaxID=2926406 RepID=UPI001FF45249|nr:hypothetical protein [Marivita sp. S6314]MCK0150929.1 hypothetical protein [Marivita sp. S6314]
MSFFEPSPVFLAFIFVQRFVFFEVLGLLALLRVIVGQGSARIPAAVTLTLCAVAVFTTFAPALNLQSLALYPPLARLLALGGGMVLPVLTSAIFAVSLLLPMRRWRWIDAVHCVGMIAFLGLWAFTRV